MHRMNKSVKLLIVATRYLPKGFISVSIEMFLAESTRKHQPKRPNNEVIYCSHKGGISEMERPQGSQFQWSRISLRTQVLSISALAFSALQDGRLQSRYVIQVGGITSNRRKAGSISSSRPFLSVRQLSPEVPQHTTSLSYWPELGPVSTATQS